MQRITRVITINLGLIIGALVVAEIVFGNWIFGLNYSVLNVPRNETRYFDVSEFVKPGKVVVYTRDQYGLRGDYGSNPSNIDVLVIGGSTTNELYLDDRETWVAQLQEKFTATGHNLFVANAAIDGQSTRGHIRAFDLWLSKIPGLRPRYVIGYLGINDVAVGSVIHQFDEMKSPEISRQMRHYIMNHSVFYNQFRRIRGTMVARRTRLVYGANSQFTGVWMPVSEWTDPEKLRSHISQKLDNYKRRLQVLSSRIKRLGAEPIYVTQRRGDYRFVNGELETLVQENQVTDKFVPSDKNLVQMSLFNEVTLAFCRERKLYCIDLAENIDLNSGDFYDAVHTLPSGSTKISNYIFTHFRRYLKQDGTGT